MKTGLVLVAVLALAGCETTTTGAVSEVTPADGTVLAADTQLGNYPAAVQVEMKRRGLPSDLLIKDKNGCWGLEVEVTVPRSGVQLKGPDGKQICA